MKKTDAIPNDWRERLTGDALLLLLAIDREEAKRLTRLIRSHGRVPLAHRSAAQSRLLDYWRHARGYLRWRISSLKTAEMTHYGKHGARPNGTR